MNFCSLSMKIFKLKLLSHLLQNFAIFLFTIYEVCSKEDHTVCPYVCVCVHTHIEPRGGKVKARVHAFGWEIEKQSTYT